MQEAARVPDARKARSEKPYYIVNFMLEVVGLVRRQMKFWSLKMCQALGTGACATPPSAATPKPFISQK
jgi:hypothetical protein